MVAGKNMLFVTQQGDQEVLVFDDQGRHLRTIGRNGAGPGEFDGLASIGLLGDTLWAIDTNLRRVSLFRAGDGVLISTTRYESDDDLSPAGSRFYFPYPELLLGDGTLLGFGGTAGHMIADGQVTRQPTLRIAMTGKVLDTLAWVPLARQSLIIRGARGGALYAPQIFSDGAMVEYAPTAQRIYVIDRTTAATASHAEYTVTAIRLNGDTLWSRRYPYTPRRLHVQMADSVRRRAHQAYGTRFSADEIDKALFIPEFMTPITAAVAGEDGTLWLRREDARGPSVYDAIDADGRALGQFASIRNARLRWVSGRTAWGEELDADNVPVIVRYRVDRP